MSLVDFAQEGTLPKIQLVDVETLKWIEKNRPDFVKINQPFTPKILEQAKKYLPSKQWFLKKDCVDSIHGIRHILRVIANASNLIFNRKTNLVTARNLLISSSLHDLRRKDDKGDEGHAIRARDWFIENSNKICRYFEVTLSIKDIDEIASAIYFHEIPYGQILSDKEYLKHKEIIDLLKTADALDRYRLSKLRWWINDDFVIVIPDESEKSFAYNLVVNSEKNYLPINDSVKSVLSSLL